MVGITQCASLQSASYFLHHNREDPNPLTVDLKFVVWKGYERQAEGKTAIVRFLQFLIYHKTMSKAGMIGCGKPDADWLCTEWNTPFFCLPFLPGHFSCMRRGQL